jgi:glycerol-3-phosphate acyltransferase PlsY
VFLALAPVPTVLAFLAWLAVILRTGFVSLASLVAALVLPVAVAFTQGVHSPLFVVAVGVSVFVFWSHRANIGRLRRGEEHRFGAKKPPESPPPPTVWDDGPKGREPRPDAGSSLP